LNTSLGIALLAFFVLLFAIALWSRGRVRNAEDYLVAGRRLPLSLSAATLFATWFGAGTMLTATDEVRDSGLRATALEPIGAGLCLVVAGLFFASRLWRMHLITLPDFYRRRFGLRAEILASIIMVPGYFGWIAAQFVALAGILELFWGIPFGHGLWVVAGIGTAYTLLGGMWSVTLTDAAQLVFILVGLAVLAVTVMAELAGSGPLWTALSRLAEGMPADKLTLIPTENFASFVGWVSVLAIGVLGNIPGQDLTQRMFASRTADIARSACVIAGVAYVALGFVPVLSGLAADVLRVDTGDTATLPALAVALLSPPMQIVFVLAVTSAVMSTIESAILAPSTVLSNNLLLKAWPRQPLLRLSYGATLTIAAASLGVAYLGRDAYELLETAYAVGMVGLFVPLTIGLYSTRGGESAAIAAMAAGILIWGTHLALGWEFFGGPWLKDIGLPQELAATGFGWLAYEVMAHRRASGVAERTTE